jgi:hypothetical protein
MNQGKPLSAARLSDSAGTSADDAGLFTALLDRYGTLGGIELEIPDRQEPARAADFTA